MIVASDHLKSDYLRDARIVVIGAGVVGAAIGYRLAQAGADVTIVERRHAGSGTSASSFAWLNSFNKHPRHYHRLNVMSIRDHQDLADELDGDWVHVGGGLHWRPETDATRVGILRDHIRRLREWGMRIDQTTPEIAMRELEPDVRIDPEYVSDVYLVYREGWLDPVAMAHGTTRGAVTRYGARLVHGAVIGFDGPSGAVSSVRLEDETELPADVVINATGPEAGRVAELAGASIELDRQPGTLIVTAPAPVRLQRVVHGPEVYVRPDGGARLLVGGEGIDQHAVEGEPLDPRAPEIAVWMDRARAMLPGLAEVPAETVRVGVRSMPGDGLPIVGFDPAVSGLYHAVTHSGITLSARVGLLVTEELSGGDTAELEPYRPGRFAAGASPRQGARTAVRSGNPNAPAPAGATAAVPCGQAGATEGSA
jgi:glycine/D-amino acid oxidase-like deaminating enzyme